MKNLLFCLVLIVACSDRNPALDSQILDSSVDLENVDAALQKTLNIIIDGEFSDWDEALIVNDPKGDAKGPFDVTRFQVASRGTKLFVHFDIGQVLNLSAGEESGDVEISIKIGSDIELTLKPRLQSVFLSNGSSGNYLSWMNINYSAAPSYASNEFELSMDLAVVGAHLSDTVVIRLKDSDEVSPIVIKLDQPVLEVKRRDPVVSDGAMFRLVTQNTHFDGLNSTAKGPALGRILSGLKGDILCIQEAFDSSAEEVGQALDLYYPLAAEKKWNTYKTPNIYGDSVIASHYPIKPLPGLTNGFSAAIVQLSSEKSVVIVSLRLKCCGYINSDEDKLRSYQVLQLTELISNLRSGMLGEEFLVYKDAPIIVAGDWNLVGARDPLTYVEDRLNLTLAKSPQLIGNHYWTWSSETSGYPPGRIDYILYDQSTLNLQKTFVLNSMSLNQNELDLLGLRGDDSQASDHLAVIADFSM